MRMTGPVRTVVYMCMVLISLNPPLPSMFLPKLGYEDGKDYKGDLLIDVRSVGDVNKALDGPLLGGTVRCTVP